MTPLVRAAEPNGRDFALWPIVAGYRCRQCGDDARSNPADNREWACARCNGASHTLALNFAAPDSAALRPDQRAAADAIAAQLHGHLSGDEPLPPGTVLRE
jgi:hypothetical protein